MGLDALESLWRALGLLGWVDFRMGGRMGCRGVEWCLFEAGWWAWAGVGGLKKGGEEGRKDGEGTGGEFDRSFLDVDAARRDQAEKMQMMLGSDHISFHICLQACVDSMSRTRKLHHHLDSVGPTPGMHTRLETESDLPFPPLATPGFQMGRNACDGSWTKDSREGRRFERARPRG